MFCSLHEDESEEHIWSYEWSGKGNSTYIDLKNDRFGINNDLSLQIEYSTANDSGIYICANNSILFSKYYIRVFNDEPFRINRIKSVNQEEEVTQTMNISEHNLQIFYEWTSWTDCSRCNKTGLKKRVGICKLKV